MAGSSLGGSGPRTVGRYQPMSAINVTPFVDVMLVLLVVFMVAAPLLTVGVPVDLPQTGATDNRAEGTSCITINGEVTYSSRDRSRPVAGPAIRGDHRQQP
jgi:biopolymer transport protein TolR